MILVDTSIWADHLREIAPGLTALLNVEAVLRHPFVTGELALGSISKREAVLKTFDSLPRAIVASCAELRRFIEDHALYGRGAGYIDIHLLACVAMTPETELWTRDKRLRAIAEQFGLAFTPPASWGTRPVVYNRPPSP